MLEIKIIDHDGSLVIVKPSGSRFVTRPFIFSEFLSHFIEKEELVLTVDGAVTKFPLRPDEDAVEGSIHLGFKAASENCYVACVAGGWLPAAFAQADVFLLDANIAKNVRSPLTGRDQRSESLLHGARALNPILAAMEGKNRRMPTLSDLAKRNSELCERLRKIYPNNVEGVKDTDLYLVHNLQTSLQKQWQIFLLFLEDAWPLLGGMKKKESFSPRELFTELELRRERSNLNRDNLIYLLAVDSAFSKKQIPPHSCPGRAIIKPHKQFSDELAYNVFSDIINFQIAALSQTLPGKPLGTFCTADLGLAGAWALLRPGDSKSNQEKLTTRIQPTEQFAPLLADDDKRILLS